MHSFDENCGISPDTLAACKEAFRSNPVNQVALNAVTHGKQNTVAMNHQANALIDHTFSTEVKTAKVTNQEKSGRCWMFAGLNTLRIAAIEKMNLKEFEFSQNYCMFWDKFERCNFFLESVLRCTDETVHGRLFQFLMGTPLGDGGQWDMFVNLITKYGVVPKTLMPETTSSSETRFMNQMLFHKLREYSCELRSQNKEGVEESKLRENKNTMMQEVYRILAINLGEPPTEFNWQYRDKDEEFHRDEQIMTPLSFYDKYVGIDLDDYVSLLNCPTEDKPFNQVFALDYLGNLTEGRPIRYLNVDIDTLKNAASAQLQAGEAVWFGCDVGKYMDRFSGIMDTEVFDYDALYSTQFTMTKSQRVDHGHSVNTHAMVLTGVDIDPEGKSLKWKVENSWGEDNGNKGYFVMTDRWLDQYLFQVVVAKKYVAKESLAALDKDPIVLAPWDPMGALAMMS